MAESLQHFQDVRVGKDSLVAIEYTIRNGDGQIVDTTQGRRPFVYLHGHDQIVPAIEAALTGHRAGSTVELSVAAADAYGERDPDALRVIPRRNFPAAEEPEKGCLYRAIAADGRVCFFTVIEVTPESVLVDTNHPLAGQTLGVHVEILSVMDATHAAATC